MGLQLIFVVETKKNNSKKKDDKGEKKDFSDCAYIKETCKRFYSYKSDIRLDFVNMCGKGNYKNVENNLKRIIDGLKEDQIDKYNMNEKNKSVVIYCVDCDDYDIKFQDKIFLQNIQRFCMKKNKEEEQEAKKKEEKINKKAKKKKSIKDEVQVLSKVIYDFVWFCRDIEQVYWGHKVPDNNKERMSSTFSKDWINNVDERKLKMECYTNNSSNILTVLNSHIDKEKWQNQYYFKKREEWN